MKTAEKTIITVKSSINAPVKKVWEYWTKPEHITQWNNASDDWHTPWAKNDLRVGGRFTARMEARDGSMGFEFGGTYDAIQSNEFISYTMDDGRKVDVTITSHGDMTTVTENFEAEETHSIEMQQGGWQAIMDNFRKYTEAN